DRTFGLVQREAEMVAVGIGDGNHRSGSDALERTQQRITEDPRMTGANPASDVLADLGPASTNARMKGIAGLATAPLRHSLPSADVTTLLDRVLASTRGRGIVALLALFSGGHASGR